ncbi:hypothetical protein BCR44DRAFT_27473 [Catenaria anguillulae PL171]|uniref:Ubiquitin-like domain-containing protein n=1 Tax=Catenaria anguillulae PL171 TaxID=765915 RepID=A0A1Y2HAN2_9FUNG|nr:hypothetical protein BCR44DRAFT_27473 [Catenaria anguillulae PL171]
MDQDVWDMDGVRRPYLRGKGPSQGHSEARRKRKAESIELALGKGNAAASAGVHDAIGSATKKQRQLTRCSIRFRDQTGSEVEFRVSRTTTFAHIANGYADIKKQPVEDFWFTYDGSRLRKHDEATLEDLDLQDGDVIDVGLLQIGC